MKKVRLMLATVAVLAVVGGALAFKAKKDAFTFYRLNPSGTACDVAVNGVFATQHVNGTIWQNHTISPTTALPCSVKTTPSE